MMKKKNNNNNSSSSSSRGSGSNNLISIYITWWTKSVQIVLHKNEPATTAIATATRCTVYLCTHMYQSKLDPVKTIHGVIQNENNSVVCCFFGGYCWCCCSFTIVTSHYLLFLWVCQQIKWLLHQWQRYCTIKIRQHRNRISTWRCIHTCTAQHKHINS